MKKEVDFIIVGQGIAGSMLAWFLQKANASFVVIDATSGETASRQATGLVNPITGRRFVKSWLIDELLPLAEKTYTDIAFVEKTKVHKVLHSIEQANDFEIKKRNPEYATYLQNEVFHLDEKAVKNPLGCVEISPVLKIDTALILDTIKDQLQAKNQLINAQFDYADLKIEENIVSYKDVSAKKIIFCEGVGGHQNPYFNYLPLKHAKGEVLFFKSKDLSSDFVLSSYANIIPAGNDHFYIGATYDWDDLTFGTTEKRKEELLEKLQKMIHCPVEIVAHKAGIRPTVIDRRPLVGNHPKHQNLYIFNGMGTKGLSLAPYFAQELVLHLTEEKTISPEVNITRHAQYFTS